MAQDVSVDTTMKFILSDEKNLDLALQVEKAMPYVQEKLIKGVTEDAKKRLEEWCKNEEWEVVSLNDDISFILQRKGWPKQNEEWEVGVTSLHNSDSRPRRNCLKVHLPDATDVYKFKSKFEELIGQRTKKHTVRNSSLIEQQQCLEWTEENLKKAMRKDEMASDLAEKMKEWALAVDTAVGD